MVFNDVLITMIVALLLAIYIPLGLLGWIHSKKPATALGIVIAISVLYGLFGV